MSLNALREQMAWPSADDVLTPIGMGARVLVQLAKDKIERALARRLGDHRAVRVGLLTKNPASQDTEAPVAVVCEFQRAVDADVCALAHKLAWNFARTPLLITIEPHQVRTWSCCERPSDDSSTLFSGTAEIEQAALDPQATLSPSQQAAHALHWVRLATGEFFQRFPDRFKRDGRADRLLLQQLTLVRKRLQKQRLDEDTIHDLLARVVFAQFLFDRKDANGLAALNPLLLARLHKSRVLQAAHNTLASILADYDEAYRFFRWLNAKFNGDLFPGKGKTKSEREAEWRAEQERVQPVHLTTLADFVSGQSINGQRTFWRLYNFDVVPLEFVSSIYEEFVTSSGAHYTPSFLVDFILDEVLSWSGDEWNLKVLDPACGSGIFLVKSYQRLIQRWKNAHPRRKPPTPVLRRLLERNLFGIDIDPAAVRVASFSLYLTMCDEIDPKNYLNRTKFPRLRDRTLICSDFFAEDHRGFRTQADARRYDLIVGNAPWGEESATELARRWANDANRKWQIVDKGLGTLFLPKSLALAKRNGRVSMIQPAGSLLFNRSGTASRFRKRLFSEFAVQEIVNLSALRFELFGTIAGRKKRSVSPPCIVTLRPTPPEVRPLVYVAPKEVTSSSGTDVGEAAFSVVVQPHDVSKVWPNEAEDPSTWTALAWGGRRDLALVQRLTQFDSLEKERRLNRELAKQGVVTREGVIRGDRKKRQDGILGCYLLEQDDFPEGTLLFLDAGRLRVNSDPSTDSKASTSFEAFQLPQLIIKQAWTVQLGRFKAALVTETPDHKGAICSQSYVSVHADPDCAHVLESAALSYNSAVAVYFLLLTSGRLASYRLEPLVEELLRVPIVPRLGTPLNTVRTHADIDVRIRDAFGFKDAEWALIEDLIDYTLPDFKGDADSPGRRRTIRAKQGKQAMLAEPHLAVYCQYFMRVLKAGFGLDKPICSTIFQDSPGTRLPVRLAAVHLDLKHGTDITVETMDSSELCQLLIKLDKEFLQINPEQGGILYQRVARVYSETRDGRRRVPTIYIVKPDRIRYWTRSAAMRDADEVAADLVHWKEASNTRRTANKAK